MIVIIMDFAVKRGYVLVILDTKEVIVQKVTNIIYILIGACLSAEVNGVSVECGGFGKCDTSTGLCSCSQGFSGAACYRKWCPNNCNNHGRCVNMKNVEIDINSGEYKYKYSGKATNELDYVCVCDGGYKGGDCSESILYFLFS